MLTSLTDARYVSLCAGEQPIPGFHLIRRRGRGGFGEVWEAEASGGFLVALKFVRLSSRGRAAELRALEFVRGIHHPNLLANFGSWLVDDTLIIGMELADRSLWDRHVEAVHQGYRGIPRGELLGYLAEVAAGIDHLNDYRHTVDGRASVGVQHRDLKPPNILLFGGGAKVADLGMARAMEGEVASHTGVWTFPYAAPEFFRGETARQSDQYGLAATYCQLRGGRLPFGGSAASVTAGHLFARPDLDALPEPERPIVERALAKVPGDRWPSCREFVAALRKLPADAVPDILFDPDGPPSAPRESQIADAAYYRSGGFGSTGGGGSPLAWHQDSVGGFPMLDFHTDAPVSGFASPVPTTGAGSDLPPDSVPTRILPALATPPPPTPSDPAPLPRQSAGSIRLAVLAATVAAIVAAVALLRPGRDHESPVVPLPSPQPLLQASPIEPADHSPGSAPSGEAAAALPQDGELIPGSTALVPPPMVPESVGDRLEPTSALVEVQSPPSIEAPTAPAAGNPPGPGLATGDRTIALEGPIEMDTAAARPLAAEERGADSSAQVGPPMVAPDRATGPPRPLVVSVPPPVARLPVPERSEPKAIVPASPTPVLTPARALASASPPAPDRGSPGVAAEAAYSRGRDFFIQKSFTRAAAEFDESIRLNPNHITSYLVRAVARHRAGDPGAALADYATVIRARPDDVTAYLSRGQAFHELGSYDRAIADYDHVIQRRPSDGDAHFRRGLARFRMGDYDGSVVDFTETLRLDRGAAYAAEFLTEAQACRDAQLARASTSREDPVRPTPSVASTASVASPTAKAPALAEPAVTRSQGEVVPTAAGASAAPAPLAVRATSYLAPPPPGAAATARNGNPAAGAQPRTAASAPQAGSNPAPADRRRSPARRILPWPFPRPR